MYLWMKRNLDVCTPSIAQATGIVVYQDLLLQPPKPYERISELTKIKISPVLLESDGKIGKAITVMYIGGEVTALVVAHSSKST